MSNRTRVVITGMGWVTPLGTGLDAVWEAMLSGRSGAGPITYFDPQAFDVRFAAQVKDFDPKRYMEEREARRLDPFAQYAMAGAVMAVADAGIDFDKTDRTRCGVILASGIGGLIELEEQTRKLVAKGPSRVSPFFIPKLMMNAAAGNVSIRFGLGGPNFAVASACASANHSMGLALRALQHGDADLILTGGSEATVTPTGMAGFAALRALSTRNDAPQAASRPFDKERDGFVLGEGAGILVFETLEHALRRGARIHAEVLGFGQSGDAHHITAPEPTGSGAVRAIRQALADARVQPGDVSYVNAHGTSTPLNDEAETNALKEVFGAVAKSIPVSSTKSMTGHLLGAAAAVELIACTLSIRTGRIHPTINYSTPDPKCDLDYVPNQARDCAVRVALSNAFGFGGHNTCMVVGKYAP
ncbi:MAG: beta-ketoacyl-ACP synthase II [Planctomycetes bacterium]|nr:beta-ketoacyl-ACP synthase II [Planctomycetota bacterium]